MIYLGPKEPAVLALLVMISLYKSLKGRFFRVQVGFRLMFRFVSRREPVVLAPVREEHGRPPWAGRMDGGFWVSQGSGLGLRVSGFRGLGFRVWSLRVGPKSAAQVPPHSEPPNLRLARPCAGGLLRWIAGGGVFLCIVLVVAGVVTSTWRFMGS